MTARAFHQDTHPMSHPTTAARSDIGAQIGAAWRDMGVNGRRWTLAGIGAACALGLGVAAAMIVQLPADMKEPIQAQEQTLAQTELPSIAQAQANALNNPPAFRVADAENNTDNTLVTETPVETTAAVLDEKPTGPTATTNTTGDGDGDGDDALVAPQATTATPVTPVAIVAPQANPSEPTG